jgi:hydroxymethylbilane synthase
MPTLAVRLLGIESRILSNRRKRRIMSNMAPVTSTIVVGSRASHLARTQAGIVLELLRAAHPHVEFRHRIVTTSGDKDRRSNLVEVSQGSGAFVKELENALLARDIDLAVHSLKDLPTSLPPGLILAAVPAREDPRDAICGCPLSAVPRNAKVGTGSPRRKAQLLRVRPDIEVVHIRGNVPPRLRLLRETSISAVILANAGLRRLGLDDSIAELLPISDFIPAAGQGALGLEARDDDDVAAFLREITHHPSWIAVNAERAFLHVVQGGCTVPVGVNAISENNRVTIVAQIISFDGRNCATGSRQGLSSNANELAVDLANDLLDRGGRDILRESR